MFWDTESWVEGEFSEAPHRFRLGWIALRRQRGNKPPTYTWEYFDNTDTFWRVLESFGERKGKVWCLAHNIVYDLWMMGGLDALYAHGYKVEAFFSGGPTTILRIKNEERTIMFLDTLNWFAGALSEWGRELNLPKLDTDPQDPDSEKVSTYCRRDVEILTRLYDTWSHLVTDNDLGTLAITVGGQAFNAFRHKHMHHKIHLHSDENALVLERGAYHGGRTECWWIGTLSEQRYTVLDVHSMYPHVMRDRTYPSKLMYHYSGLAPKDLAAALKNWGVIARVRLRVDQPVVPLHEKYYTMFPIGTFETSLAGPELELAARHGEILKVHEVSLYEMQPLFRTYVNALYRLRQRYHRSGKELQARLVKKLLNTLYGKWGQKSRVWLKRPNDEGRKPGWSIEYCIDEPGTYYSLCLGREIFDLERITESTYSFPAIAAYVTAYARCVLWSYIEKAGIDHVYYMDTDSLLVDDTGLANLAGVIHPSRLGRLGVEQQADNGEIRCPKDYRIGDHRVIKGLTRNAVQVSDTDWKDLHWPKLRGLIEKGITSGYANTVVRKQLRRNYRKGEVTPSGRVIPWEYEEPSAGEGELPF